MVTKCHWHKQFDTNPLHAWWAWNSGQVQLLTQRPAYWNLVTNWGVTIYWMTKYYSYLRNEGYWKKKKFDWFKRKIKSTSLHSDCALHLSKISKRSFFFMVGWRHWVFFCFVFMKGSNQFQIKWEVCAFAEVRVGWLTFHQKWSKLFWPENHNHRPLTEERSQLKWKEDYEL